jgi:dolichol-phosphate mannosyltransferase
LTETCIDSPVLSVVVPAYGELENLRGLIPSIRSATHQVCITEILVVLPLESDPSEIREVEMLGARVIIRGPSDSFGDALRSGFSAIASSCAYVITMDADGSHDPTRLPELMAVSERADVVVASRYIRGGKTDNSLPLRTMSQALNLAFRITLQIKCRDISTNFKRYKAADIRALETTSRDFDVVEEILFRIKIKKGKEFVIAEIPDHFKERQFGTTKRELGPFIISYITTLVKLRWRLRRVSR